MVMRSFENEELKAMLLFENMVKVQPRDCIIDPQSIYFLVEEGKAGIAIGKDGSSIKKLQERAQKRIRVFEYSENVEKFVKNMVPKAKKVEIAGKRAIVTLDESDKAAVIGKNGSNIKKLRRFLERNSKLESLDLK